MEHSDVQGEVPHDFKKFQDGNGHNMCVKYNSANGVPKEGEVMEKHKDLVSM